MMQSDPLQTAAPAGEELKQGPRARPAVWPVVVLSVIVGLWLDFGGLHRYQNADSLVPVLDSLYRWTFFFWEQDRFGMLIPLMATPFQDPLTNLMVQTAITASLGAAALSLMGWFLVRDETWVVVGSASMAGIIMFAPPLFLFQYFSTWTVYNASLFFGFLSLLLLAKRQGRPLRRWRVFASVLFMLLACWVNGAAPVFLFPLVFFRSALVRGRLPSADQGMHPSTTAGEGGPASISQVCVAPSRLARPLADAARLTSRLWGAEFVRSSVVLALGLAFALASQKLSPYRETWIALPPLGQSLTLLGEFLASLYAEWAPWPLPWLVLALAATGLGVLWICNARTAFLHTLLILLAALLTAASYGVLMAVFFKARTRYFIPGIILLDVTAFSVAARAAFQLARTPRTRLWLGLATSCLALLATFLTNGLPSLARVRAELNEACGDHSEDVVAGRCTHVAGDYWDVWPTVFHVNLTLYSAGKPEGFGGSVTEVGLRRTGGVKRRSINCE